MYICILYLNVSKFIPRVRMTWSATGSYRSCLVVGTKLGGDRSWKTCITAWKTKRESLLWLWHPVLLDATKQGTIYWHPNITWRFGAWSHRDTKIQLAKETLLGNGRAIKEDLDSCFNGCWTFSSNLPPWTFVHPQTCQGHPFAVDNTTKALEEQKKKVVEKSETARGLCRSTWPRHSKDILSKNSWCLHSSP